MTGAAPGPGGASEGPELELIQTEVRRSNLTMLVHLIH